MKILLLGCTSQEHAMARQLDRWGHTLYCQPGNAGIEALAQPILASCDPFQFAESEAIDLTVTSSEQLLAGGIADLFGASRLCFFGPSSFASRLGCSRFFAKRFMERCAIPTARSFLCRTVGEACAAAARLGPEVVVKSSSHTVPVVSCSSKREVEEAVQGEELLVEERLQGEELSLSFFCDGKQMVPMPPIIDQKLLCDGERGLNTGGMGAYGPVEVPHAQEIEERIVEPTRRGLLSGGFEYRGILSLVIMLTERGPLLLEYRCQCGDPEAQVVFPLLESDLAESLVACAGGDLSRALPKWREEHACTVVLASSGYPGRAAVGEEVHGLGLLTGLDSIYAYHDGTSFDAGRVVTSGGRVVSITGVAPTLERAIERAYQGAQVIDFPSKVYREDIGLDNSRTRIQAKI